MLSYSGLQNHLAILQISKPKPLASKNPNVYIPAETPSYCRIRKCRGIGGRIVMRDRSNNRKPLQKGRNMSIEAIQTVQALKRAAKKRDDSVSLEKVFDTKLRRLLKFDMVAVLRELVRQNECELALKVFEDVRKEHWYRPRLFLYTDIITALASNGMTEEVEYVIGTLKQERDLEPDDEGFDALLRALVGFEMTDLVMDSFRLMRSLECEAGKPLFWLLVRYLESKEEMELSQFVRVEAKRTFWSVDFLDKEQLITDNVA